jgi:hypothetical protein
MERAKLPEKPRQYGLIGVKGHVKQWVDLNSNGPDKNQAAIAPYVLSSS